MIRYLTMAYIHETNIDKIWDVIHSVDNAVILESTELENTMNLMGFQRDAVASVTTGDNNIHIYKKHLTNNTLYLRFRDQEDGFSKMSYKHYHILHKEFFSGLSHRAGDLPASIQYEIETGCPCALSYFLNGELFRADQKPFSIVFSEGSVYYEYGLQNQYTYPDFFLHYIIVSDNHVENATFCYRNQKLTLKQITQILPYVAEFSHEQIRTLNNSLSPEERSLIEMVLM